MGRKHLNPLPEVRGQKTLLTELSLLSSVTFSKETPLFDLFHFHPLMGCRGQIAHVGRNSFTVIYTLCNWGLACHLRLQGPAVYFVLGT